MSDIETSLGHITHYFICNICNTSIFVLFKVVTKIPLHFFHHSYSFPILSSSSPFRDCRHAHNRLTGPQICNSLRPYLIFLQANQAWPAILFPSSSNHRSIHHATPLPPPITLPKVTTGCSIPLQVHRWKGAQTGRMEDKRGFSRWGDDGGVITTGKVYLHEECNGELSAGNFRLSPSCWGHENKSRVNEIVPSLSLH